MFISHYPADRQSLSSSLPSYAHAAVNNLGQPCASSDDLARVCARLRLLKSGMFEPTHHPLALSIPKSAAETGAAARRLKAFRLGMSCCSSAATARAGRQRRQSPPHSALSTQNEQNDDRRSWNDRFCSLHAVCIIRRRCRSSRAIRGRLW